jgi:hypothetical protein
MSKLKKTLFVLGIILLTPVCVFIVGFFAFNSGLYVNFCNLRGSRQRFISETVDITDNTYRLGGIGRIGIGSTRQEILNAVQRRDTLASIFCDFLPRSAYSFFDEPFNLPYSTLGFSRTRTWNAIEFLLDENDSVTHIRITPMH